MNRKEADNLKKTVLPRISVVTVSLNSAKTIRRTLESVTNQTYPNVEYIIIDGGSSDQTLSIVDEYKHSIAKMISEPDKGIYDAMNKGVRLSTGSWIHILNSDDYYADHDVLQKVQPYLDPIRTNYFMMWREHMDGRRDLQNWKYRRWKLFISAFMPHPAMIISRQQYEQVGLYDAQYKIAADHDMILRLTSRWPGLKHDVPLSVMLQGGVSEKNMERSLQEFQIITERHGLPGIAARAVTAFKRIWWGI